MTTTPYNNLPLYDNGTVADLRDAYNRSMQLIDKKLHQLKVQEEINHPTNLRKDN